PDRGSQNSHPRTGPPLRLRRTRPGAFRRQPQPVPRGSAVSPRRRAGGLYNDAQGRPRGHVPTRCPGTMSDEQPKPPDTWPAKAHEYEDPHYHDEEPDVEPDQHGSRRPAKTPKRRSPRRRYDED